MYFSPKTVQGVCIWPVKQYSVAQQQKQCGVLLILRPAPPHNMTQNGRRKKPDKWRELLKEAEQLSAEKAAEVELLMQVQEVLQWRQQAIDQVMDCLDLISGLNKDGCCNSRWAGYHQQLRVLLGQPGDRPQGSSTLQPHTVDYLRTTNSPDFIKSVCSLTDQALLQRVGRLMGKCAIMVVQDQGAAAWQPQQHPSSSGGSEEFQLAADCSTGPARLMAAATAAAAQQAVGSQGVPEGLPASRGGSSSNSSNTCATGSSRFSGAELPVLGPAFEVSAMWGVLFEWDQDRFLRIISRNLETGAELQLQHGPGFGQWMATKLQLTAQQISVLKGLRDLVRQPHEVLPGAIQQASVQQELLAQHQQQQRQWADTIHSAEQVFNAQVQALQLAERALDRFYIMAKVMGLVTLNTLLPCQLATLHACNWPAVCRIEPILDVLDDLQPFVK